MLIPLDGHDHDQITGSGDRRTQRSTVPITAARWLQALSQFSLALFMFSDRYIHDEYTI